MNDYNNKILVTGVIEKIVYSNENNDFKVCKLRLDDLKTIETIFGNFLRVDIGEHVEILGEYVTTSKYGKQIKVSNLKILPLASVESIEKYLGSGIIKGIGPVMAKRIVSYFGDKTIEVLDNDIESLSKIDGIGLKRISVIKEEWQKQLKIRDIMIFLQSIGITPSLAKKIFDKYGENTILVIKDNPYKLCDEIFGVGFKTADKIAIKLGIEKNSLFRLTSGIIYLLKKLEEEGNCYFPKDILIEQAKDFLDVEISEIEASLEVLSSNKEIIISNEKVYLTRTFEDEIYVAQKLKEIKSAFFNISFNMLDIDKAIEEISKTNNIFLDEDQLFAIKSAINEKILIITGSPGTGKSTIINFILNLFELENLSVVLAAPTGRASKRLEETTGREAKTIHRLLEYNPKQNSFLKNEHNKLTCDLLIIDESSMLDIRLFRSLLEALDEKSRIIFVGDYYQLPSVGPGNVLSDLINSNAFKVVKLNKIYRQFGKSIIIKNAHLIKDGLYPKLYPLPKEEKSDFYFIEKNNPEETVKTIIELICNRIPNKFGYDPLRDIQIIVPVNKGIVGVENLNYKIQSIFNKSSLKVNKGNIELKLNDKIIQQKNNYEKDVYNGDIGFIRKIDFELQKFKVDFIDKEVQYDFCDVDELSLSYAISIHKSQGSEFKCVIIPILTSHYMLLQRNLLYTAVTRAKELAILIGSKKAIGMAVSRNNVERRYTNLKNIL